MARPQAAPALRALAARNMRRRIHAFAALRALAARNMSGLEAAWLLAI